VEISVTEGEISVTEGEISVTEEGNLKSLNGEISVTEGEISGVSVAYRITAWRWL